MNKDLLLFIPIIGIYLAYKYNILSNKKPFIFFTSAFFQAFSIFILIFILILNVSN
jgi:hypothetical protein